VALAANPTTFAVTPATLTVTPDAGQSMVYGAAMPTLTYTASGFINGDPASLLTGSLGTTATPASPVGSYAFTLGTLAAGSNYTVALAANPTTFAVTPATLLVTASNAARTYGVANPPFTATFTGFVNGQTLASSGVTGSPSLTTSATAASPPGSYVITAGPGSLTSSNYTFTFGNGTLNVTATPLSATGVTFVAVAGTPYSGPVATFTNADPYGSAASYTATITWGDGSTSAGTISGTGNTLTVTGAHTYLVPGNQTVSVQISHKLGYTTSATAHDTATVFHDVVVTGVSGNDTLEVMRTAGGGPGEVTYVLNGGAPVSLHWVSSFTFVAGAGNATMIVNLANGGPIVSGGAVVFSGGAGADTLDLQAAGLAVDVNSAGFKVGGQVVNFTGVTATHINDAGAVNTFAGPDTADRAAAFAGLTPQERFVQTLYLDELGRDGAKAELDNWVDALNAPGMSQATVAAAIEQSPEARDHLVRSWYLAFLGRQAANGEELGWANLLLRGQSEEQVLSQIFASPEFYARAQKLVGSGSADERYVQAMYQVLLGRTAAAAEVAAWVQALPSIGAQAAAQRLLSSTEYRTDLVDSYYNALLHRPPDSALADWVFSGLGAGGMRVGFESTGEFFTNG
jgi:hypothetical protein